MQFSWSRMALTDSDVDVGGEYLGCMDVLPHCKSTRPHHSPGPPENPADRSSCYEKT